VLAEGGRIFIRQGEVIVAEHQQAAKPRSCVIAPEHLQALWRQSVQQATAERHAPPPRCRVEFLTGVEQRPLSIYAEVAG
jgi:hypothetical protein